MNSLDEEGIILVRNIIKEMREKGTCILISSHYKEDIEILCDCPVRMAWIFRIFDCTAYGVHPSVAAGKLWDSVSHAVCGGRCQ